MNFNSSIISRNSQAQLGPKEIVYTHQDQLGQERTDAVISELIRVVPSFREKKVYFWGDVRQHIKTKFKVDCDEAFLRAIYLPFSRIEKFKDIAIEEINKIGATDWKAISKEIMSKAGGSKITHSKLRKWYEIRGSKLATTLTMQKNPNMKSSLSSEHRLNTSYSTKPRLIVSKQASSDKSKELLEKAYNQPDLPILDTRNYYISTNHSQIIATQLQQPHTISSISTTTSTLPCEQIAASRILPGALEINHYSTDNISWMLDSQSNPSFSSSYTYRDAKEAITSNSTTLDEQLRFEDSLISLETILLPETMEYLRTEFSKTLEEEKSDPHSLPQLQPNIHNTNVITDEIINQVIELQQNYPYLSLEQIATMIQKSKDYNQKTFLNANSYIQGLYQTQISQSSSEIQSTPIHIETSEESFIIENPNTSELVLSSEIIQSYSDYVAAEAETTTDSHTSHQVTNKRRKEF